MPRGPQHFLSINSSANHIPLSHRNLINNQKSTAFQPKSNISRQLPHFYIDHHISLHNVFHILSTTITLLLISFSRIRHRVIIHALSIHTRDAPTHQKADGSRLSISTEEERQCRWHKRARQTRSVRKRVEYGQQPVIVNEQRSEDGYNPSYQFVDYIPRACR